MVRGFILQPGYRTESGRAVVQLYGKLESGRPFLLRDRRCVPHFFVRADDRDRAARLGARVVPGDEAGRTLVTLRGRPAVRVEVERPSDASALRDRLHRADIPTYEADVRFAYRYLIDRGIRATLAIEGPSRIHHGIEVFEDPDVRPADWTPRLTALSLDIETDPAAERLLSVGLHGCGAAEVLLLTPPGADCPAGAVPCPDERAMLQTLVRRVRALDPDVITGWNVVDFDLAVLARVAERAGVPLALGRTPEPLRLRPAQFPRGAVQAELPGRVVLDGIQLLRGAFVRLESFSLEGASREILGRGKTMTGKDRAADILRAFETDRPKLVEYNLNDARLVSEILDKLHLLELTVERSRLTGMPPDRVAASIASFDFLYLSELRRRGVVAPTVRAAPGGGEIQALGGHVLDPAPGVWRNVLVCDFKSLYPSVIRTFQIDPLGLIRASESPATTTPPSVALAKDGILAPNGAVFRRERGILPALLDELFPRRERAKAAGDKVASQAIKILMNSFYGVLGTSACRFADPSLANAITGFGREILLWSKARIEGYGYRVLYGDTDSLFVLSGADEPGEARQCGERLVSDLNRDLARHIATTWRVESRLELEFETLYLRLLLPAMRHGTGGARKRYAGLVDRSGSPDGAVVFTGMEVVRRDWTALAKEVQRELYDRLFRDRPVEDYLRAVVADLRAGRLDDRLVYRKALRKPLDDYTAQTPPHVAAARKLRAKPGRVIRYVVTTAGPEPAAERRAPFDHEHYVQKQVRAVAEPVLAQLGLDFDRVVGDDNQLRLF